jgi:hypothetical protein
MFLPALLSDPDIRFIAAYTEQQIVAGAIANRTGDVVGSRMCLLPKLMRRAVGQDVSPQSLLPIPNCRWLAMSGETTS